VYEKRGCYYLDI